MAKTSLAMPPENVIERVEPFTPGATEESFEASGGAAKYTIIWTSEVDAYEKPLGDAVVLEGLEAEAVQGDDFSGTARRAAKISVGDGPKKKFDDLNDLIKSLTPDADMINHTPKIKDDKNSKRVIEEQRNVSLKVWLYAASREDDNDFHLILGRRPTLSPVFMNMELSGLPSKNAASFKKLNSARTAFKDFFGEKLPGKKYQRYPKPIPVLIEGSLFFDITHAHGQRPGPPSMVQFIPTIWEVHPITKIVFEP
jgi:hypothetical protein